MSSAPGLPRRSNSSATASATSTSSMAPQTRFTRSWSWVTRSDRSRTPSRAPTRWWLDRVARYPMTSPCRSTTTISGTNGVEEYSKCSMYERRKSGSAAGSGLSARAATDRNVVADRWSSSADRIQRTVVTGSRTRRGWPDRFDGEEGGVPCSVDHRGGDGGPPGAARPSPWSAVRTPPWRDGREG